MDNKMKVPYFNLGLKYNNLRKKCIGTIDKIASSGQFLEGQYTTLLEEKLSSYTQKKHCNVVGSGTDALYFALRESDVTKVLVPSYSYLATGTVFKRLPDVTPIVCDVNENFLIDLHSAEKLIYEHGCDGLIFVNLFGNPVNPNHLKLLKEKYNLTIIEDGAQSIGCHWDGDNQYRASDIVTFSFDPTKMISGMGNGGAICSDEQVYGVSGDPEHNTGHHSRMNELDAAYCMLQWDSLDQYLKRRREIANQYNNAFKHLHYFTIPRCSSMLGQHAYLRYVLQIQEYCNTILSSLEHHQIGVRKAYNYTIPQVIDIPQIDHTNDNHAYMLAKTNLALPMYPELTDDQVDFVIEKVLEQV